MIHELLTIMNTHEAFVISGYFLMPEIPYHLHGTEFTL
jgi:hypothetical protein